MKFIEFIGLLLIVYLVTQIFLPAAMPKVFETNWFFKDFFRKKKLPISDKVQQLSNKKGLLETEITETRAKIDADAESAKRAGEELDKLK